MKVKHALQVFLFLLIALAMFQIGSGLKIASKAWLSQELIQTAWAKTLSGKQQVQPWPWADTWPVAELEFPEHSIKQIVLSGDSGRVLAFGPGLESYEDSGLGVDMTFISGHRDTHFRFLDQLEVDEVFTLRDASGIAREYEIVATQVVDENWRIPSMLAGDSNLLVLATCYPIGEMSTNADQRLLVFAKGRSPLQV